ncbi:zinc finger BED domain-containing protein RICESLEEPER 3-like [Bidens hawaiensis]|uniref:zinc finger BED domain-containing protein RICESLEEPER 3-like n=1 Tax=Bidens hawaiensis TaxID=980011 RepID=UPI004049530E
MASQGDKFASDTCTPTPVASNTPTYSTPQGSSEGVHDSNEPPPTNFTTHDESNLDDTFEDGQNVGGKRKRSAVWNHFKLMKVNGEDKAECNYCKKKLGDIRQSILIMEQKKVDGSSSYLSNYTFNPDNSRRDLAEMIIVHEYPLTTVDHHGFRKFVQGLQPLFKVPSRNTIKSDILKIYEYERVKTKKLLGRITSRVAITTDMWTANHQRKGFMAVTAHFIDDSWNLQSRIMR